MEIIEIRNCNCIKEATISVEPKALNIKYGINGTGKSTISKAISIAAIGGDISVLRPYGISESDEEQPEIQALEYETIKVFDDSYVNDKLLSKEHFFDNPYMIFLNTGECENLENKIVELLADLQGFISGNDSFRKLKDIAEEYHKIFKMSGNGIAKTGGVGELLKGNGAGFDKYPELDVYKPFYENRTLKDVSDWANWRREGVNKMNGDNCPFCTTVMPKQIENQNILIDKVFKKSALSTASAVLELLNKVRNYGYVSEAEIKSIEEYVGDTNKSAEMHSALSQLGTEIDYIDKKIGYIFQFRPMNVTKDQLEKIEDSLEQMKISKDILRIFFSTQRMDDLIYQINNKVDELTEKTRQLKSLFEAHEKKLNDLVEKQKEDINEFLAIAGFPYEFELVPDGEKKAKAYLVPVGVQDEAVKNPKEHLSWGEKNVFSLVMFMFEALSDNADLIVLDDPISAFDSNKKFAVIRRLFDNKKKSFRDRTVLLLTHDLQPIIDYVHGGQFTRMGLTTPVVANWIQNVDGIIDEKVINTSDLKNIVELTKAIYLNTEYPLHVRIVNLRKYIEITNVEYKDDPTYQLVSNLIHGRPTPTENDVSKPLDISIRDLGDIQLKKIFAGRGYDELIRELSDENLKQQIDEGDSYHKVLAFRLLLERHEEIFKDLRKNEPGTYKFINETNHIENDYVFQLNPLEFYSIPELYLVKLRQAIEHI